MVNLIHIILLLTLLSCGLSTSDSRRLFPKEDLSGEGLEGFEEFNTELIKFESSSTLPDLSLAKDEQSFEIYSGLDFKFPVDQNCFYNTKKIEVSENIEEVPGSPGQYQVSVLKRAQTGTLLPNSDPSCVSPINNELVQDPFVQVIDLNLFKKSSIGSLRSLLSNLNLRCVKGLEIGNFGKCAKGSLRVTNFGVDSYFLQIEIEDFENRKASFTMTYSKSRFYYPSSLGLLSFDSKDYNLKLETLPTGLLKRCLSDCD